MEPLGKEGSGDRSAFLTREEQRNIWRKSLIGKAFTSWFGRLTCYNVDAYEVAVVVLFRGVHLRFLVS